MGRFTKYVDSIKDQSYYASGWLTGKGEAFPCSHFSHMESAQEFVTGRPKYAEIEKYLLEHYKEYKQSIDSWLKTCEEDGGGWHNIEFAQDDLNYKAYKYLRSKGWIRMFFHKHETELNVEGTPETIKAQYELLQRLKIAIETQYYESFPEIKIQYDKV